MKTKNIKGFTLVELVIVIVVIAILAAVLIPTFTGVIKDANVSADSQQISTLNKELQIIDIENEIKTESDLEKALNQIYGNNINSILTPKSINQGNHYWYNIKTKKVELRKSEYVFNKIDKQIKSEFNNGSLRLYGNYYLLDRSGSEIINVITKFENFTSEQDYFINMNILENCMSDTNNIDIQLSIMLYDKISKTTIISNYGRFRFDSYEFVEEVMTPVEIKLTLGISRGEGTMANE